MESINIHNRPLNQESYELIAVVCQFCEFHADRTPISTADYADDTDKRNCCPRTTRKTRRSLPASVIFCSSGSGKFTPTGLRSTIVSDMGGGLAIDSTDNLFVGESHWEQRTLVGSILKITPSGVRTTFASIIVAAMAFQPILRWIPRPGDFNNDGKPDYSLYNANTRQTAIWYLNNDVYVASASGPTLPAGWSLVGVADFNRDGHPDYLLFNSSTRRTVIWYLNNNVLSSGLFGPTLPVGWTVVGVTDFNRDGHGDYLLFNASTGQTAIWYLNNNVAIGGVYGPTVPSG